MGVQNLWMLLAAGGRQVSMESLSGQVLAVDASIWLTQFVKAMRDPEDGSMLRNAHLIGTFHRVSKLLYYGIRPVFVFDGDTPAIKLKTLQLRRSRREKSQVSLTQTAQRLLLKQLKEKKKEAAEEKEEMEEKEEEKEEMKAPEPFLVLDESSEEKEPESDEESNAWKFQHDHFEAFQRDQRQEARETFITLAGKPEEYSLAQIRTFLKTSKLKSEMKAHRQEIDSPQSGRRIASESDRRYVYVKEKEPVKSTQKIPNDPNARILDNSDSTIGVFSEYVRKQAQSAQVPLPKAKKLTFDGDDDEDLEESKYSAPMKLEVKHPLVKEEKKPKRKDFSYTQDADGSVAITIDPTKVQLTEEEKKILPPSAFVPAPVQDPEVKEETVDLDPFGTVKLEDPFGDDDVNTLKVEKSNDADAQGEDSDLEWESVDITASETARPSGEEASEGNREENISKAIEVAPEPEDTTSAKPDEEWNFAGDDNSDFEWGDDEEETKEEVHEDTSPEDTVHTETSAKNDTRDANTVPVQEIDDEEFERAQENQWSNDPEIIDISQDYAMDISKEEATANDFEIAVQLQLQEEEARDLMETTSGVNDEALETAMQTASNLTQWAAGAVKRAILNHQMKNGAVNSPYGNVAKKKEQDWTEMETPRYLTRVQPPTTQAPTPVAVDLTQDYTLAESLSLDSEEDLRRFRNQQMRDVDGVTDEMKNQVMELLRLFGVPFLVCPMEAEAQCATLEQLGLVSGVITDDSDIFPFGGKRVYKNMFKDSKFVEAFYADDIERELGLNQDSMIALALLLGSDYTDGIHGVGIVNATEIVHAFNGLNGMEEFKKWVNEYNIADHIKSQKKLSEDELSEMDPLERFKYTHNTIRRHWNVSTVFPNPHVIKAYKNPETDRSTARFSWSVPDLAALRVFCGNAFGWNMEKINATLLPVVQAASRGQQTQTRIDSYFTSYNDNIKYAKIRSKRLKAVVGDIQNDHKKKKARKKSEQNS